MLTTPSTLESYWQKARDNLQHMSPHRRNFWLFESSVWFHMLGNSMIAIFIPILMLQQGFEIKAILFFYLLFHLINTPTNFAAGYLVSWIGARKTIMIATLCQIGFFILYASISPDVFIAVVLLGALAAFYDALYYTASLYLFMKSTVNVENSGKNTGILYAIIRSAALVGPLVGSAILLLGGGQGWVIVCVIISFIISLVPLFYTSLEQGERGQMEPLGDFITSRDVLSNHVSLGLFKIHESIANVIWPVFIFIYFSSLESVAFLAVLVPVVGLVASFLSGRISKQWRAHAIAVGAFLVALVWLGRIGIESSTWYYLSVVLAGLLMILMQVPIDANIFRTGNQSNPLMASVVKNMFSMGTKTILFAVLYFAFAGSEHFTSIFVIAILALVLLLVQSVGHIIRRCNKHAP